MRGLAHRVSRLEALRQPEPDLETGRRYFWDMVAASEGLFLDEDRRMSRERVESMSLVAHLAWLQRFEGQADLERVIALYGHRLPTTGAAYITASTIIHGDDTI